MSEAQQSKDGWQVGHRGGRCAGCDVEFVAGAEAVSALYRTGDAFDRRDYCEHLAVAAYLQNLQNARIRGHREHDQRLASGVGL